LSYEVVHVSGRADEAWLAGAAKGLPAELRSRYHLFGYLHGEFPWAMAAADLAFCRAGASVLGELPAAGLPAVLVPYPYAGAHQRLNARYLADNGAAVILDDHDLGSMLVIVGSLLHDASRLDAMSQAARRLARPEAAKKIARLVLELVARHEDGGGSHTQRVHLVGVGGIHMSGIAQVLRARGHSVSGSDLYLTPLTEKLEALGVTVSRGHDAANVGEAELVVYTSAAHEDNPEIIEARRRGLPTIKRAQMVAHLMEGKRSIAIAGSHGKTTTSSLIAFMLCRPAAPYLHGRRRDGRPRDQRHAGRGTRLRRRGGRVRRRLPQLLPGHRPRHQR
jgi:hypothetical protein